MDRESNAEGICATCDFRGSCLSYNNSRKAGRTLMYCEEFYDLSSPPAKRERTDEPSEKRAGRKGGDLAYPSEARGLCLNCDHAGACGFAGIGENVVFCEEHSSNFENAEPNRLSHAIFTDLPDLGIRSVIPGWNG